MSIASRPGAAAPVTFTLVAAFDGIVLQRIEVASVDVTIGRLPDNTLVLPNQEVSRHHAVLTLEQDRPMVWDVGSSSGTFVGSMRLLPHQPVVLEQGVEVHIGPYVLTLELERATTPALPSVFAPPSIRPPVPELDELPTVAARETWPALLPVGERSRYVRHLPSIFQDVCLDALESDDVHADGVPFDDTPLDATNDNASTDGETRPGPDFLGRMLLIFEAIWEPLEQRQEHIAMYFNPATSPERMLTWMAEWLNLDLDPHWPERRRRELLREAMQLYWWRGTRYGLTRMLEVCAGQQVRVTEDPEKPFVFRITIPQYTDVPRDFIEGLIRTHKPAHVGYLLEVSS